MKEVTQESFKTLKHIIKYVILFIVIIVICIVIKYNFMDLIQTYDELFLSAVRETFLNTVLTKIVKVITFFGSAWFLVSFALILLIFIKNKQKTLLISTNLLWVLLMSVILKHIFERPRPESALINEIGYSFPSAHAMCSVAFYGFLIVLIQYSIKNKLLKYILISLLIVLIIAIAFTRLYLNVHYLSDVIMGIIFGLLCLGMFINILKYYIKEK